MRLFEKGREGLLGATIDWDGHVIKAALLDLNTADVGVKLISSSTNASPIVVTTTAAHGFTNGDLVYIADHLVNTSGNGIWTITAASGSVFSLTDPVSGANATGNGVGTTSGYAVNLGLNTAGTINYDAFDGCQIGTPQTLTSPTIVGGVADAADVTYTAVSGATVEAIGIYDNNTGVSSTSPMIALITGKHIVTANATLTAGTTLVVEPLAAGIPNGQVLAFSTGQSATVNATANAGDRSITVLSTTVTAGGRALATNTAAGLPVTPNGGNINITWDNGVNKIFRL